ncbi:hypothetical protein FRC20_011778 [Serendipita sp. 405]|nr:hypothetical protein FRC20_011778 [Serendipita sp. 405]
MQANWREIGARIYNLLDDNNVRWTSIDPLAFAEAGAGRTTFSPLLIWIGVEPASLTYELANTVAEAISFFLTLSGFSGFEIGFRESVVTRSARMLPFDPFNDTIAKFRKPFTPTLGLAIAPFNTTEFEGTGALYFRESKDSKRVILLTCAHVTRPPPAFPSNTGLAHKTSSYPREYVVALGESGYNSALKSMMDAIDDQGDFIKVWKSVLRRLGDRQEGESAKMTAKRDEHLALVQKARETIDEINHFHDEILRQWAEPDQRIIGEVIHVEPGAFSVAPHGFTHDWALIELYDDKFDWTTFKGNKVYVGGNLSSLEYGKIMFPWPEDQANYEYPEDGLLQAFGVVPAGEIYSPQYRDAHGERCLLVVKNGLATGTTIGRVMGMESFTRVYKEYGIKETSMEIAVLPYSNATGLFSAPGDSGSIVLDRNGRILGMLTGGAGTTDGTDVTYLTPYWYLEAEIKKHFPNAFLYDVVVN